jgi:hypothetical protein
MPVTEEAPEREPTLGERFAMRTRQVVGASERMPIRVFVLFVTIAAVAAVAPEPANIIGVAAVSLLALDTASHRR